MAIQKDKIPSWAVIGGEPVVGLYFDSSLKTYYWDEVDAVTGRKVK